MTKLLKPHNILFVTGVILITGGCFLLLSPKTTTTAVSDAVTRNNLPSVSDNKSAKSVSIGWPAKPDYSKDFQLYIPKIKLNHRVIAQVDPVKESEYLNILTKYVAHGKYTRLPDQATVNGNVYLFAHSDGPDAYFRNLRKLGEGDEIRIRYQGKEYLYRIYDRFIIKPTDTWVYTGESKKPSITLQTCENDGQDRLIVKAELISVN